MLLNHQHARAGRRRIAPQNRQKAFDDRRREPKAKFIDQQHLDGRHGEGEGKHCCSPPESRPALRSRSSRNAESTLRCTPLETLPASTETEVLRHGQPEEHASSLRHMSHPPAGDTMRQHPSNVQPEHLHRATHWPDQPGNDAKNGRLSGAVRPKAPLLLRPRPANLYHGPPGALVSSRDARQLDLEIAHAAPCPRASWTRR